MTRLFFITHSSFLLETERARFLFDYFGKGEIPEGTKPLVVLASHNHHDHYNRCIFSLPAERFLISDTVKGPLPEAIRNRVTIVHDGSKESLFDVDISCFGSTDLGVSFLLRTAEMTVYHAGDNNYWEEEDRAEYHSYIKNIDYCDIAMIPVDPRLDENFIGGARDFDERIHPKMIVPMHFWGDFTMCTKARAILGEKVVVLSHDGEEIPLDSLSGDNT